MRYCWIIIQDYVERYPLSTINSAIKIFRKRYAIFIHSKETLVTCGNFFSDPQQDGNNFGITACLPKLHSSHEIRFVVADLHNIVLKGIDSLHHRQHPQDQGKFQYIFQISPANIFHFLIHSSSLY